MLYIQYENHDACIFEYGVIITWGMPDIHRKQLYDCIKPLITGMLSDISWEQYPFEIIQGQQSGLSIKEDRVYLPKKDTLDLLSISHALAQSAALDQFESLAEKTIIENEYLAETLADTGKIPLSRKSLAKLS